MTHLLQRRLDELALHVADGHVQLVDLEVPEDDLIRKDKELKSGLGAGSSSRGTDL